MDGMFVTLMMELFVWEQSFTTRTNIPYTKNVVESKHIVPVFRHVGVLKKVVWL